MGAEPEKNAEADNAMELARKHRTGQGVEPDWAEAARWLEKAASAGNAEAAALLAHCMLTGEGALIDPAQANIWLQRAAAGGHTPTVPEAPSAGPFEDWISATEALEKKPTGRAKQQLLADLQKLFYFARLSVKHIGPVHAGRTALLIDETLGTSPGAVVLRIHTLQIARAFLGEHAKLRGKEGGSASEMSAAQYHKRKDAVEALLLGRQVAMELAVALAANEQNKEAAALLEELIADREQPLLVETLGAVLEKLGRKEEALKVRAREQVLRQEICNRLLESARTYESAGDLDSAMTARRHAAEVQGGTSFQDIDFFKDN